MERVFSLDERVPSIVEKLLGMKPSLKMSLDLKVLKFPLAPKP